MSYLINLAQAAKTNQYFRQVLHTGAKSQLVIMNLPVGEDIGEETHDHVEQVLYFQSGTGKTIIEGQESALKPGDVLVVSPKAKHNIINTGNEPLIIATVYVPPNHIDGTVHRTRPMQPQTIKMKLSGNRLKNHHIVYLLKHQPDGAGVCG
ncbi:MAG: cupin domain-containing protein [Patescibacteria group bacterium]